MILELVLRVRTLNQIAIVAATLISIWAGRDVIGARMPVLGS